MLRGPGTSAEPRRGSAHCHGGAAMTTPLSNLVGCHVSKGHNTLPPPLPYLWPASPALMQHPKESAPKFRISLPNTSPGLTNSIILPYKSCQADTRQALGKWELGPFGIYKHMRLSAYIIKKQIHGCRAEEWNAASITPAARLAPGDAASACQSHRRCVPTGLPGLGELLAASLRHKASSYAQCPPSGTGLCSSLSGHVQESHDNCRDTYF